MSILEVQFLKLQRSLINITESIESKGDICTFKALLDDKIRDKGIIHIPELGNVFTIVLSV